MIKDKTKSSDGKVISKFKRLASNISKYIPTKFKINVEPFILKDDIPCEYDLSEGQNMFIHLSKFRLIHSKTLKNINDNINDNINI